MTYRVLTAGISHETNTFSIRPTGPEAFRDHLWLMGEEAVAALDGRNTELAGVLDVGRERGWDVAHVLSAAAGPGGRVTREAFEALTGPLLAEAARGPWDGVLLILHGAMVTEDEEDGDGRVLALVRAALGPDVPVAVTLDPHANVTEAMCAHAQVLVSYATYPHVDMRATGRRAAALLHRAMAGEVAPRTLLARRPMLEEANGGRTDIGPMIGRQALARAHEAEAEILAVSINAGFPNADVAEVGPTVLVTVDAGHEARGHVIAEALADDIWARRREVLNTYLTAEAAAAMAAEWSGGGGPGAGGPLVIADYADNPGAGAYGDSTALLAALLAAGVRDACLGPMVDPEAARGLQAGAIGETVTVALGGRTAPEFGGGPIEVTGTLRWRGPGRVTGSGPMLAGLVRDFGPSAVLRVGGIDVLVVTHPHQILDLEQFRAFGIEPATRAVVALKSMQHFRAAFAPIAGRIVVCDSGALCTLDYGRMPYVRVPRPIFPLDDAGRDGADIDAASGNRPASGGARTGMGST